VVPSTRIEWRKIPFENICKEKKEWKMRMNERKMRKRNENEREKRKEKREKRKEKREKKNTREELIGSWRRDFKTSNNLIEERNLLEFERSAKKKWRKEFTQTWEMNREMFLFPVLLEKKRKKHSKFQKSNKNPFNKPKSNGVMPKLQTTKQPKSNRQLHHLLSRP
jgi:hypothetical protein